MPDAEQIQRMFARVAPRYDRLNRILSCGIDAHWRSAAVRLAEVRAGELALDVCTGTAGLARTLQRAGARVLGADFCIEMLERAGPGSPGLLAADAMSLPFRDGSFDLATVGFGIRNVADPHLALCELRRVVRPGGRVVVLEFSTPRGGLAASAYLFYFRRILPKLGRMLSPGSGDAYRYLPDSVMQFPEREEFLRLMTEAGLARPRMRLLLGGVAALYRGEVEAEG